MKCLVTGGSGFLGSHIADELSLRGHQVTIFDKKKSKYLKKNQKFISGNLKNKKTLEKIIKGKDIVFHFAAIADIAEAMKNPKETVLINIIPTINMLELSLKYKIKRFFFASTIYVNSEDGGFYKSSKRAVEDYIEEYSKLLKLKFTILRYGSIFGSRSNLSNGVNRIISHAIKKNEVRYFGNKKTEREYINVKNAAIMTVECLKKKFENKHVVVTGNKKIKIIKLLETVKKYLSIKKSIKFDNKSLLGHYISKPNTYKFKKGIKVTNKKNMNFDIEIKNQINLIKKNKRIF